MTTRHQQQLHDESVKECGTYLSRRFLEGRIEQVGREADVKVEGKVQRLCLLNGLLNTLVSKVAEWADCIRRDLRC